MGLQRPSNTHALVANEDKKKVGQQKTPYKGKREQQSKFSHEEFNSCDDKIKDNIPWYPYCNKGLHHEVLICHSGLGTENMVSQRIQTNIHKIGKMVLQWK